MKITIRTAEHPSRSVVHSCQWGAGGASFVYRPTWVEINQKAFIRNLRRVTSFLPRRTRVMAVVKANAYGHLAVPLAKSAVKSGVAMLGVSSLEEGIALREAGIRAPVLIMGSIYPLENFAAVEKNQLIPTISSFGGLNELARRARTRGKKLPFHLKIDTGMGRVGISPSGAARIIEKIASLDTVVMDGMYTHFACADANTAETNKQITAFRAHVEHARALGLRFTAHAANSAALFRCPASHFDLVRPGISLYGISPCSPADTPVRLSPVLAWKTRIIFLKRVPAGTHISYGQTFTVKRLSIIATLPVGYADGYFRALSNRGEVLVRGRRCRIAGRVTMDMTMLDVTSAGASVGDEAVLIGAQGGDEITASELAAHAGTIPYEITCAISGRVPRVVLP